MENRDGVLFTTVYQKPSYEPYYLPFNSIHPLHMKKNIPFTMLLRVIRYCSTFQTYLDEREKLRMTLLLNKYPNKLIEEQFNNVLLKCNIDQPLINSNYDKYRQKVIDSPMKQKATIDYEAVMFIHFTYCSTMKTFPAKFHLLWHNLPLRTRTNISTTTISIEVLSGRLTAAAGHCTTRRTIRAAVITLSHKVS
ncbi:unnamed protein product [Rotaria sordida]|uniref:Helix-turn-helix domain-containing protein n=1 Tax=Rotaria sordida TaxID=392033 RepID=A0A820EGI6_9BILA|nr:unnamed protein product [Rotaria sordida]